MRPAPPPTLWQRALARWPDVRVWAGVTGLLALYQANELMWAVQMTNIAKMARSLGGALTGWRKWLFSTCEFFHTYWPLAVLLGTALASVHLWMFLHGSARQRHAARLAAMLLAGLLFLGTGIIIRAAL